MTDHAALEDHLARAHPTILGAFRPASGDAVPDGIGTLPSADPKEPGVRATVTAAPAVRGATRDPPNPRSRDTVGRPTRDPGGKACVPLGGPPRHPFVARARRSGRAWSNPVGLPVHDACGSTISYRGAIGLRARIALPLPPSGPPCAGCARPCPTAYPAGAFSAAAHDAGAHHRFPDSAPGRDRMSPGRAARRARPIGRGAPRASARSAVHMRSLRPCA